jgi:ribosomal-protein-alanine N-acetyltransferase
MLRSENREFLTHLDSNADVMQFIHTGPLTIEEARSYADTTIELAKHNVHFHKWLVEVNYDQARIGWVELAKYRQEHRRRDLSDDVQIGYEFAPEYWNAGYATEAARAVVNHVFSTLALDRLVAFARPENTRSVRVLEKLGFAQDGFCTDEAGNQCGFYVLPMEVWQSQIEATAQGSPQN